MNYYNEWDKKTAAWLRELVNRKLIPKGEVDERSICDVQPDDLRGFTQVHLFAGIGGWAYALQLADWPSDRPVWTGSCPCQPFSVAGKRKGTADVRHLWPEMFRLIRECRPATVFGEQVASKAGREWLGHLLTDVEGMGYAGAGADLCSAGINADHIRQRLFWVADSGHGAEGISRRGLCSARGEAVGLRNGSETGWMAHTKLRPAERHRHEMAGTSCGVQGEARQQRVRVDVGNAGGLLHATSGRFTQDDDALTPEQPGKTNTRRNTTTILCGDGKTRRIESGIAPVAHGLPARVVRLRGYGNAIDPRIAAKFIRAFAQTQGVA